MELSNVILTKSLEWAYEKEIRFYKRLEENYLHYNPEALKAIIVGRRMKENKIDDLKKLLNEFNKKNNTNTKLLYAHRVVNSYNLGIDSDYGYRNSCETNSSSAIPILDGIDQNPITTVK